MIQCAAIICTHSTSRSAQALRGGSAASPVLPLHFPPSQLPSLLSQHLNRVRQVICGRWVVLTGDIQYRLGALLNYGMLKQKFKGFAKYANSSFRTQCGQKEPHTGTYLNARPSQTHNIAFLAKIFAALSVFWMILLCLELR